VDFLYPYTANRHEKGRMRIRTRPLKRNGSPYFGQKGCQQTNSEGYHFPSPQQRCIVQPAGPQAAVFKAPGMQAAGAGLPLGLPLPFAMESLADPAIASPAIAAASASFDTNFFIEQLPSEMR
jgi:hypothetical protein